MQKTIIILIAFSSIAFCSYSQNTLSDEDRLKTIEQIWHQAYIDKTPNRLDTILSDGFIHINGRGGRNFKTDEIKSVTADPSIYQLCYPYDMEIKLYGDNALVIGKTHEKGKTGNEEFEGFYFWTDYFVKHNGLWQCILAQTAPLPQAKFSFGNNLSLKDSALTRETHTFITELVKQDKFSGVVIILKNDSTIYRGAFGNASKEFNSPNTFATAFNLASMTKMFTGIAIAQLVEQKKLSFNDLITKYLSDLPNSVVKDVTVYHLLTHTSGLSSYWTDEFHQSNHAKYRTLQDYLPLIKKDKQQFKPGTQWAYSNTGYMLLGLIIEKISGMNYFDYIKKNIFEKAGMSNADFYESDIPNRNVAFAYTRYNRYKNDTTKYFNTFFIAPVKGSPAGGAYASGEDLVHFVRSLTSNNLLSKKITDTVIMGKVPYGKPEQQKKYGFGFANQIVNNKLIIFHDGGANGISTDLDIYPELGYAVIVLCNYDDSLGWEVVRKTRTLITR